MMKEEKRSSTGFLVKQRAFLKLYMITMTEQERLYGLKLLEVLRSEFKEIGFKPNHTEVYRSLHELLDDGILKQIKVKKKGLSSRKSSSINLKITKLPSYIKTAEGRAGSL